MISKTEGTDGPGIIGSVLIIVPYTQLGLWNLETKIAGILQRTKKFAGFQTKFAGIKIEITSADGLLAFHRPSDLKIENLGPSKNITVLNI